MEIYSVPINRRYWVIRADGGKYYSHFLKNNIIALGHTEGAYAYKGIFKPFSPSDDDLESVFRKYFLNKGFKNRKASSFLGQIKTFTNDLNVGDWIITIGNKETSIGRIISGAYLEKNILRSEDLDLTYELRRKVVWGPKFKRSKMPHSLKRSLKSNLTLFNIDKHREAIYHSSYPYFRIENKLYLSTKIGTTDKIKNIDITSFLSFLNELEVIAKNEVVATNMGHFDEVFEQYANDDLITMTTEAEFHSPGEIWTAITGIAENLDSWMAYIIGGYAMIFGNQKMGFDGIIDLQTRQQLWGLVIERMKKKKIKQVSKSLELDVPNVDTVAIESDAEDETKL